MTEREPGADAPEAPEASTEPPLPSKPSAGQMIGGIFAGLESLVTGRPKPVAQIEEQYTGDWASADGHTVDGLDEPIDRPEPPDRPGAKL
jgi:hypothetical protein